MRAVWISGAVSALLLAGLAWYLHPVNPGILSLQFAATPRAFGDIVHMWSPEQLRRFRSHLPVDFVLLMAYGIFGYLLATRTRALSALGRNGRKLATWALPSAAIFDATENALHWWLTEVPRFGVPIPYAVAAASSAIKWLLILGFALTLSYGLAKNPEA